MGQGLVVAVVISGACLTFGAAAASETCAPEAGGSHEVMRVLDGETLLIDDGREVRLSGALAPKSETLLTSSSDWPPAQETVRALEAMILHRTITLRYDGRRRDRYGRVLAQIYVARDGAQDWVQRALVSQGLARAYALPGNSACAAELIAAEADARALRRGLWSRDLFRVRTADDVEGLLLLKGRFVVVEGRVSNVAHVQKTTYINFGTDWRRDFTASLARSAADRAKETEVRLNALAGKIIRVRGWIERRNGPMVALGSADEIEVVDQPRASEPADASPQADR